MPIECFQSSAPKKIDILDRCLEDGNLGFGEYVIEFEREFQKFSNLSYNIGFNSATAAASAIFRRLYEKYGRCDVWTPSLTFISPSQAAAQAGHHVLYVDIDDNLLFDVDDYLNKRRPAMAMRRNKSVVMPMLYGGVSAIPNMDKLIGDEIIVVDSAHCITPEIKSDYTFFSFHTVKPISMGSGGMISTENEESAEYFRKFRNFGRVQLGHSYDIVQDGSNSYMNNLNAAIGLSQIDSCIENIKIRRQNYEYIQKNMDKSVGRLVEHGESSSYYLCALILDEKLDYFKVKALFGEKGVQTTYHYPPIHTFTHHRSETLLDNTELLSKRLINLPIHQNLTKNDMEKIVSLLGECRYE